MLYSIFDIWSKNCRYNSFQLLKVANCKKNIFDIGIQLDIGPNHVLAVSGAGLVTIFDKFDGSIEYLEDQHGSTRRIF